MKNIYSELTRHLDFRQIPVLTVFTLPTGLILDVMRWRCGKGVIEEGSGDKIVRRCKGRCV